ncbi:uncharacterized protein LOC134264814 [Saccostrea cucullata]|uniref:uncharacterized protein LOC134264814 n=1 Tax=Saccostrea cuccullata TaxID=36930 RepID=UPI002ED08B69
MQRTNSSGYSSANWVINHEILRGSRQTTNSSQATSGYSEAVRADNNGRLRGSRQTTNSSQATSGYSEVLGANNNERFQRNRHVSITKAFWDASSRNTTVEFCVSYI